MATAALISGNSGGNSAANTLARMLPRRRRQRILAGASVAALHTAMGLALISGFGVTVVQAVSDNLKTFDVHEVPPPLPPAAPAPRPRAVEAPAEPESAAAPENLRQTPVPVVVPPPVLPLNVPPPVTAAPVPAQGPAADAGASDTPGPGTGAGGEGTGTGSGQAGNGTGSGVAVHSERIKGRIKPSDYPDAAYEAHAGGTVFVRLVVGADGRVSRCDIDESSGRADLDSATCRIILERYRYRPARDAAGNPVPEVVHMAQVWETGRRR